MRVLPVVVAAALVLSVGSAVFSQTGLVRKYDAYGLGVTLPGGSERIALGDIGGGGLQEAYSSNGLAYIVIATTDVQPRGMGARAAIEMMVQLMNFMKSREPSIPLSMLSATTSQGVAAKGFGIHGPVANTKSAYSRVPAQIQAMFGSEIAVAIMLVPIVDNPALVGAILVVGPASRAGDVNSQATQVAGTFVISRPTAPQYSGVAGKGSKSAAPPAPEVRSITPLKKGQIELVGVVKLTDAAAKSLDMLVSQAVPFSGHGVILSPPRLKRVYVKEIPADVREGAIIIVVGGDTGPGKAVTADTLTVMDPSKLGF